jgi:hypothetical protein
MTGLFDLPNKLLMEIVPLATPASVLTAASFNEMSAVEERPSSVLTWLMLIGPDAGSAMPI